MEGLYPRPSSRIPSIEVPYVATPLAGEHTRELLFEDVPIILATITANDNFADPTLRSLETEDLSCLTQTWLFFELCEKFFRQRIQHSDFVKIKTLGHEQKIHIREDVMWSLFATWTNRIKMMSRAERKQKLEPEIYNLLKCAATKAAYIDNPTIFTPASGLAEILVSVQLLIATLKRIADETFSSLDASSWAFWSDTTVLRPLRSFEANSVAFSSLQRHGTNSQATVLAPDCDQPSIPANLLLEKLLASGLCWPQAVRLCQTYDISIINYLCFLEHYTPSHIDHTECNETRNVQRSVCTAHDDFYLLLHTVEDCHCDDIGINLSSLAQIINKDHIPLIEMDLDSLELRLVPASPWMTYVAISYVSSDGLLNRYGNSLPTCQLRRIRDCLLPHHNLTSALTRLDVSTAVRRRTILFWMDTFCIPAGPAPSTALKQLKEKAISRMALIYGAASHVLVLNRQLQSLFTIKYADRTMNDDQLIATILTCSWMTRAWTLQEGVLARSCQYQLASVTYEFGNKSVLAEWLRRRRRTRHKLHVSGYQARITAAGWFPDRKFTDRNSQLLEYMVQSTLSLQQALQSSIQDDAEYIRSLAQGSKRDRILSNWRISQFVRSWNALRRRSISIEADRLSIFANLLGFNPFVVGQIIDFDQRLSAIIRSCDRIPLSLLFNRGPKAPAYANTADSWIPNNVQGDDLSDSNSLRFTGTGLELENRGSASKVLAIYPFTCQLEPGMESLILWDDTENRTYVVQVHLEPTNIFDVGASSDYCLMIDRSNENQSHTGRLTSGALMQSTFVGLVEYRLRYIAPISIWYGDSQLAIPGGAPSHLIVHSVDVVGHYKYTIECQTAAWQPSRRLPRRQPLPSRPTLTSGIACMMWYTPLLCLQFWLSQGPDSLGPYWFYPTAFIGVFWLKSYWLSVIVVIYCLLGPPIIIGLLKRFFDLLHFITWTKTFAIDWDGRQGSLALWWSLVNMFNDL